MKENELEAWVGGITHQTGVHPRARALTLVRRVIEALEEILLADELAMLRASLPHSLAPWVPHDAARVGSSVRRMIDRVQRLELTPRPVTLERVEVVCRALGEVLPTDARVRWLRDLPPAIAALFFADPAPDAMSTEVSHRVVTASSPPVGSTLASGRPGSQHPLSEAAAGQAHRHSVARSDDPHADTRLSSTRGLTQERVHETLADGVDHHAGSVATGHRA